MYTSSMQLNRLPEEAVSISQHGCFSVDLLSDSSSSPCKTFRGPVGFPGPDIQKDVGPKIRNPRGTVLGRHKYGMTSSGITFIPDAVILT
jgi:hypothetical protein